jgi:hypothetical protein
MVLFIFLTINLFGCFSFCEFSEFMGVSQSDFQIKVNKYSGKNLKGIFFFWFYVCDLWIKTLNYGVIYFSNH